VKTIAYTALHYGTDYLGYAIKSIIDYVDEYWVLYSAIGSHGFRTNVPCPDSRTDLYTIAQAVAGDKLHWVDGEWAHEGLQRGSITKYCPDADVIIVLDADEIWNLEHIPDVRAVWRQMTKTSRHIRYPIIHYWRSFYRAVLHDPAYPVRVIIPDLPNGEWCPSNAKPINHMGYAQRPEIVRYKQLTHGHRNEWRHDCNWFEDKFMANAQTDCHPCGSEYWNPESVDPARFMPAFMQFHPYAQMEVIE
jgi:hypothetical protein